MLKQFYKVDTPKKLQHIIENDTFRFFFFDAE